MRAVLYAAMAGLLLAGCTSPQITGASRQNVTVKYDPALYKDERVAGEAQAECRRLGGQDVRLVETQMDAPLGFKYARFDCLP